MPVRIEDREYQFDLMVRTTAAGKVNCNFRMFVDVAGRLEILPVSIEVTVVAEEE